MESSGKKGGNLSDHDLEALNQIALSLEQAEEKLEHAYKRKKPEQFNATKQFILKLNKKMAENI